VEDRKEDVHDREETEQNGEGDSCGKGRVVEVERVTRRWWDIAVGTGYGGGTFWCSGSARCSCS
jgi:hypothetical protein